MFKKIVLWTQGRHTLFAVYFTIFGSILQWFHKLDGNFIALIAAVQGFVFAHSIKEDHYAQKAPASQQLQSQPQVAQEPPK